MEAQAIWHDKKDSWIGPVDSFSEAEVVIEAQYSLVSHGTERTMVTQVLPEDVVENMAVPHMCGDLNDKFTYGYSLVGRVIKGPDNFVGKLVHLMHPHQNYPSARVSDLYEIPENVDPKVATLASNLETAINAVWDSKIELGDRVLIAGYGLIGALLATIIRQMPGISVEIMEVDPERKELLQKHGHKLKQPSDDDSDYDIFFNTTGSGSVLQEALKLTSQEGKIIELSWYGPDATKLELGADFHYGRKQIISSQVSNIPYSKQGKWDYTRRKQLVFQLLSTIDFSHLIDQVIPFEQAPQFFGKLRAGSVKNLSTIIQY